MSLDLQAQLEQVWEEEDHMEKQDFDPKTFFAMHDLNGDGVLDEQEIEAILQLEAKKMYMSDPQHPGDPRVSLRFLRSQSRACVRLRETCRETRSGDRESSRDTGGFLLDICN